MFGFEGQGLIEQAGPRPVPEHGLGNELCDQCPSQGTRVIAFAEEADGLVSALPRLVWIDRDLLEKRQQDLDA